MATLTALLLPPERRGEGLGLSGVVDSLPSVVALPAGVWLAHRYGFAVVVLLTAAEPRLVPVARGGLFAGRTGYPAAFALTGLLMLAVLPATLARAAMCRLSL